MQVTYQSSDLALCHQNERPVIEYLQQNLKSERGSVSLKYARHVDFTNQPYLGRDPSNVPCQLARHYRRRRWRLIRRHGAANSFLLFAVFCACGAVSRKRAHSADIEAVAKAMTFDDRDLRCPSGPTGEDEGHLARAVIPLIAWIGLGSLPLLLHTVSLTRWQE